MIMNTSMYTYQSNPKFKRIEVWERGLRLMLSSYVKFSVLSA